MVRLSDRHGHDGTTYRTRPGTDCQGSGRCCSNDIGMIQDAVLALGEFRGEPDPSQLYKDIRGLMAKVWNGRYGKY